MKTVRFHRTGGPEVLIYEEVSAPQAGQGEVQIRVDAVGVNFADVLRRRGDDYPEKSPLPFTLGGEVAGVVSAVGGGVTNLKEGDAVYATTRVGGYAQYVVAPAAAVIPLPHGITAAQATTLVVQGLTALLALRHAGRLAKGESVLVEAAAGGVGAFAVQLAKLLGAGQVIAAASTPEKRKFAESLGADESVDYTRSDWANQVRELTGGKGVDIVLEMSGGETVGRALDALAAFGRMVVYGQASGEVATVDPQRLTVSNQSITGFYIGQYFQRGELITPALREIVDYVASGELTLHVGATFPLSAAVEAHRLLEGRKTTGKLVLEPWA
ncbi:NADPH:quinone oxidoreductase family protein [Paraburkholderia sp. BL25I1N1]|uniref:quinone oxidoreductase family protein n=1 Tax=Paraburkholderia sp. BL25I1N1 TaxID=1938804 RepID=UPI000D08276C|nr:NADPH:quinone oxidoreductase family protein [Paraburkholderia sp. BL25I1N1]PRY04443.1 NADPH:quinone reductase-like Zn-dependent oxidoreductase [Paraburkholderia sp. BL25I1N1]